MPSIHEPFGVIAYLLAPNAAVAELSIPDFAWERLGM